MGTRDRDLVMIVEVVPADCGGSGVLWGTYMNDSHQSMC